MMDSGALLGVSADPAVATGSSSLPTSLDVEAIGARAAGENFPVAMRWLPARLREDLSALYGFARWVDQIGDDADGDRLAQLDELSRDVARIAIGEPRHPIVRRLAPVVRRRALPIEPLERLIEANRRDQRLVRIASWEELVDTCTFSAHPVGELVLGLFDARNPRTIATSNAICTALQVVEHCQDVVEDHARGRVYLPAEDLRRFGCRDLDRPDGAAPGAASPELRCTIRLQVERARIGLSHADALLLELRGLAVPLIAAYAAGGLATCDALARSGYDVVSSNVRPARRDWLKHWIALLFRTYTRNRTRARQRDAQ